MKAKYIPLSDRIQLKNIVWIPNYVHKYYEKRLYIISAFWLNWQNSHAQLTNLNCIHDDGQ